MARNELSHCASFPVCVTIMLDEMASYNVSQGLLRACPGVGRDSRYSVYGTREKQHASARETDRSVRAVAWDLRSLSVVCRLASSARLSTHDTRLWAGGRVAHTLCLSKG